jgi:hypothetical protein
VGTPEEAMKDTDRLLLASYFVLLRWPNESLLETILASIVMGLLWVLLVRWLEKDK